MSPGPRIAELVDELVDDQPIVIFERRRHAQAVDARDLEAERDDQRGVDRRGEQRLHAGGNFAADALPGIGLCLVRRSCCNASNDAPSSRRPVGVGAAALQRAGNIWIGPDSAMIEQACGRLRAVSARVRVPYPVHSGLESHPGRELCRPCQ